MDQIRPAMERVIQSQRFILGEEVAAFEREIAAYVGVKHAIGVSSGTDALTIALSALGIGEGHEVITTPYTFFATTGAILRVGATPVFVDIERDSFNLDAERVTEALTPRTRAILPVHLFGQAADMRALRTVADTNALALIEDAAQALGATLHGQRAGALEISAASAFFRPRTWVLSAMAGWSPRTTTASPSWLARSGAMASAPNISANAWEATTGWTRYRLRYSV